MDLAEAVEGIRKSVHDAVVVDDGPAANKLELDGRAEAVEGRHRCGSTAGRPESSPLRPTAAYARLSVAHWRAI